MIAKEANRNFQRQNPDLVRENQLFAVWPTSDADYQSMVEEVLLGKN